MLVGALSGLFGVGGGFLMTPLLIFLGILINYSLRFSGFTKPDLLPVLSVLGVVGLIITKSMDKDQNNKILNSALIGKHFPKTHLKSLEDNKEFNLNLENKEPFLVNFFSSWCVPCQFEVKNLQHKFCSPECRPSGKSGKRRSCFQHTTRDRTVICTSSAGGAFHIGTTRHGRRSSRGC